MMQLSSTVVCLCKLWHKNCIRWDTLVRCVLSKVIRITTLIPWHEMTYEIRCVVLCNITALRWTKRQKEFNYLHENSLKPNRHLYRNNILFCVKRPCITHLCFHGKIIISIEISLCSDLRCVMSYNYFSTFHKYICMANSYFLQ